jgi:SAM-dependent methyltransferase
VFEVSKTRRLRGPAFYQKYMSGSVLDIGCGADLVVPHAQPFDIEHGDANLITHFLPSGSRYECVHSYHCLEHMSDVPGALAEWWSLVKPDGHLIIAVPHEDLYEQGVWPSIFNHDHKATFRLGVAETWSPVSYDLKELLSSLPGAEVVEIGVQDQDYDYRLKRHGMTWLASLVVLARKARKAAVQRIKINPSNAGHRMEKIEYALEKIEYQFGVPIDQTLNGAIAQIQAVVRKRL